jgi:hypothetical protein
VRIGQEAWSRLTSCQIWGDWLLVGEALAAGRTEAMRTAHTNKPFGRRFNQEFGDWLRSSKFDSVHKTTRSQLLKCLEHRAQIESWRATLTINERVSLNHPVAVLRRWRKTQAKKPDGTEPKLSAMAKLKEANIELQEQVHRLQRYSKDRAPFTPQDRAKDIAGYIWRTIQRTPKLARSIARDLSQLAKEAEEAEEADTTAADDLVWKDLGNACLDRDTDYHRFEAQATKGAYVLSPATDAFSGKFAGYRVYHLTNPTKHRRERDIADGIESLDKAKAVAQADRDRGGEQ